jgi:hypothetical protein
MRVFEPSLSFHWYNLTLKELHDSISDVSLQCIWRVTVVKDKKKLIQAMVLMGCAWHCNIWNLIRNPTFFCTDYWLHVGVFFSTNHYMLALVSLIFFALNDMICKPPNSCSCTDCFWSGRLELTWYFLSMHRLFLKRETWTLTYLGFSSNFPCLIANILSSELSP